MINHSNQITKDKTMTRYQRIAEQENLAIRSFISESKMLLEAVADNDRESIELSIPRVKRAIATVKNNSIEMTDERVAEMYAQVKPLIATPAPVAPAQTITRREKPGRYAPQGWNQNQWDAMHGDGISEYEN
jgi:hypothetical protein